MELTNDYINGLLNKAIENSEKYQPCNKCNFIAKRNNICNNCEEDLK